MATSDLNVKFTADTAGLTEGINTAKSKLKELGTAATEASSPMAKIGESLKKGLELAGVAVGLGELVAKLKESTQLAAQDAVGKAELARQLRVTAGASNGLIDSVNQQMDALERVSTVSVDKLRPAYEIILRTTGDVKGSMDALSQATNIAAGTHRDLTTVAIALARAHTGNWTALNRLVPGLKDAKDKMALLNAEFANAAQINTTPYQRIQLAFENIEKAVGSVLLPSLNKFADWLDAIVPKIQQFFKDLNDPTTQTGKNWQIITLAVENFTTAWDKLVKSVSISAPGFSNIVSDEFTYVIDKVTLAIALISDLANAFGRLANDFQRSMHGDFSWLTETQDFFKNFNSAEAQIAGRRGAAADANRYTNMEAMGNALLGNSGATGGIGGTPLPSTAATKTTAVKNTPAATVLAYITATNDKIYAAQNKFNEAQAAAQDTYNQAVIKATTERDTATEALDKQHAKNVLAINTQFNAQFASIIQQSMDLLRNAFAQGTSFDIGSTFSAMIGKAGVAMTQVTQVIKNGVTSVVSFWGTAASAGVDDLLSTMKTKLSAMKDLQANAAKLQGAGFSQAFIAQVVQSGPDVGNKLADSILGSSADTQKALSDTFNSIQDTSQNGLNDLAKTIYDTQGLQTDALKSMFTQAQSDLATALADEADSYTQSQKDIATKFDDAINTAHQTMVDTIGTAAQALYDSLNSIEAAFNAKLLTFKGSLAAFAAQIADIRNQLNGGMNAAGALTNVPNYNSTTGLTTSGNASAPGSFMNTVGYNSGHTVVVNATTNATPQAIADTAVLALKYGVPLSKLTA